MQDFKNVTIGTNSGSQLSLAEGLPLFPKLGTSRAGTSASSQSNQLFNYGATVLFWRIKASAYYSFFIGFVGPAVAFQLNSDVTLSNVQAGGQVAVNISSQQMTAGLEMGFAVGGGISLKQDLYLPSSWYSPWKFAWKTVLDITIQFQIDFLQLLFELISYLLSQGAADGLWEEDSSAPLSRLSGGISTFQMLGSSLNQIGRDTSLTATAGFTLPVNLVDIFPPLRQFALALEHIKGELSFGPALGFGIPVDLELESFTVQGGLSSGTTANYGSLTYNNNGVVASGPTAFSTTANATRLTTNVSYTSSFTVLLSCSFCISVCKLFSFSLSVPSLDLLNLLGLPRPTLGTVNSSVSTDLTSGCVLIPQMTLNVTPPDGQTIITAEVPCFIEVLLSDVWHGATQTIVLAINPSLPDFPSSLQLLNGSQGAEFLYVFPNRCLLSGADPNNPNATQSPSPTSPYTSYSITASIPDINSGCLIYEVTSAIKVLNNVIVVKLLNGVPGDAPAWNLSAGAQLNADTSQPPSDVPNYVECGYSFNYASGQTPGSANMKLALYDDQRQLHFTSLVRITFQSGASATISPANPTPALNVPIPPGTAPQTIRVEWLSPGPHVNYPVRFYLTFDAGCAYGMTEFWLNVWNWS